METSMEMAEPKEETLNVAPKGIMVDDKEYFPGQQDWAFEFLELGGEG